ncbi:MULTISPECIES: LysR family transcriptional regulator [unclassified Vibrio]|uniref:LysR family transcriptional regulator n=1 Tax=Vibrio sp. HB236076 TaxID=3232307 RepID=A0AB39H7N3_9VIBR|nr:LysR family transcriptional regulator [Vibrio sp. HB161653]MDP5253454.1 LysR family transcriptional regulator [Vibrio sp. HB161653]
MDERALKYFEVVYKTGSIRAASEVLHVSPSAISRKVAQLEAQLDISLVERVGRGIKLTEAGSQLFAFIQDINQRQNALLTKLSELDNLKTGTLRMSIGGGFISDFTHGVVSEFSRLYPGVKLVLNVGGGDEVIDSILHDEADIGVLLNAQCDSRIEVIHSCLFQALSLVIPNQSQWAHWPQCTASQLSDIPLAVLNQTFSIRRALDLYSVRQGARIKIALECNSFDVVKNYVEAGLGATVLPTVCIAKELRQGLFKAIDIEGMHSLDTKVDMVVRRGRAHGASVNAMKRCIINHMQAFNVAGAPQPGDD